MELILFHLLLWGLQSVGPSSLISPWCFSQMPVGPNHLPHENRYIYRKCCPYHLTFVQSFIWVSIGGAHHLYQIWSCFSRRPRSPPWGTRARTADSWGRCRRQALFAFAKARPGCWAGPDWNSASAPTMVFWPLSLSKRPWSSSLFQPTDSSPWFYQRCLQINNWLSSCSRSLPSWQM